MCIKKKILQVQGNAPYQLLERQSAGAAAIRGRYTNCLRRHPGTPC